MKIHCQAIADYISLCWQGTGLPLDYCGVRNLVSKHLLACFLQACTGTASVAVVMHNFIVSGMFQLSYSKVRIRFLFGTDAVPYVSVLGIQ
jgi:hypothetical protein